MHYTFMFNGCWLVNFVKILNIDIGFGLKSSICQVILILKFL